MFQYVLELLELKQIYFFPGLSRVKCYNLVWSDGFYLKGEFRDHFSLKFGSFSWSSRPEVFCKNVFFKIRRKTPVSESLLLKRSLLKKILWHRCFPVNFAKFLRKAFFKRAPPVATSMVFKKHWTIQISRESPVIPSPYNEVKGNYLTFNFAVYWFYNKGTYEHQYRRKN